jgi:adenine deaminase
MASKEMLKRRIAVAAGRERADFVLKNCRIVDVFTDEVIDGDIAIVDGIIAAIGGTYEGHTVTDAAGSFAVPGLIDAHMHLESTMVRPSQFAKGAVPHGTLGVIADPHEIANVCGTAGIEFILDDTAGLCMDVFVMVPSCVPATAFETSGATLAAADIAPLMSHPRIRGLGEMMAYPGVIAADNAVLDKLCAVDEGTAQVADGHSPKVAGAELAAYAAAGIKTDHECGTVQEMRDRLRLGMYVQMREGSACRNLDDLLPGVTAANSRRLLLCTDDKHPEDIAKNGHLDNLIRKAVRAGLDPLWAIKMATLNVAECYHLPHHGAIAPGYRADILLVRDLRDFTVRAAYKDGVLVASEGKALFEANSFVDDRVYDSVHVRPVTTADFAIPLRSSRAHVIGLQPHSVETDDLIEDVSVEGGHFVCDPARDILKLAVVERHHATGAVGRGLVKGYGLTGGAIASTVAHDSHNIIVVGDNDADMVRAVEELQRVQGGICIIADGVPIATLPLPIAGLMSDRSIGEVEAAVNEMTKHARRLGVNADVEPFMTLAFMALPVIPALKLTDQGLFDVTRFAFIDIEA